MQFQSSRFRPELLDPVVTPVGDVNIAEPVHRDEIEGCAATLRAPFCDEIPITRELPDRVTARGHVGHVNVIHAIYSHTAGAPAFCPPHLDEHTIRAIPLHAVA